MSLAEGMERIPQPHGGALLPGGVKGNAGGPGRTPSLIRENSRETWDAFRGKIAPAMDRIGDMVSGLDCGDPERVKEAQLGLRLYRDAGFSIDAVLKAWGKIGDVGLPRQSEITLENPDALNLATELYARGRQEDWSCTQFTSALAQAMGLDPDK